MAVLFTRRALPKIPIPVTITGSGHSASTYVTINGTKYWQEASGIEVKPGDIITLSVYGRESNSGYIIVGGEMVLTTNTTASYNWKVPYGLSSISIELYYTVGSGTWGKVTVTTS